MLAIYAASEVRLLVDRTETLRIGRARLALLGIDDPLGRPGPNVFVHSLAACGVDAGADFRLLLSHRPEAFAFAARRSIELTLAGHTHGFQIGWLGRSLLERLGKTRWAWGWYHSGGSALYTSAGAGDWFPFRLGCPREAPLIVLRRAHAQRSVSS
jgi:predicted MPP superfamily phosphohydrolase